MARRDPYRADPRTREAKAQGYPARSVFKLEEIEQRARILPMGGRVLDLGAAPGSWTAYAARRIGPRGRVVAVDLQPIVIALPPNVTTVVGDALEPSLPAIGEQVPFDVVLSDMAPRTSGSKVADQARSYELFQAAIHVAEARLRPGGHFVGKLFMGPDFEAARELVRARFEKTQVMRPSGTRTNSSEVFLLGRALRGS